MIKKILGIALVLTIPFFVFLPLKQAFGFAILIMLLAGLNAIVINTVKTTKPNPYSDNDIPPSVF